MQLELCDDSSDKSIGVYVFYYNLSRVIEDEDVQNASPTNDMISAN